MSRKHEDKEVNNILTSSDRIWSKIEMLNKTVTFPQGGTETELIGTFQYLLCLQREPDEGSLHGCHGPFSRDDMRVEMRCVVRRSAKRESENAWGGSAATGANAGS